jgi:serine/threonine protein kinase
MRELLAAPILPPSALDAMIPRELDRIVMRSLAIDPKDRYQTAADMAADLERTLIAARYSSRELSKLLQELYMAGDDPLVIVDASDDKENLDRTVAITSTTTLPPTEHTRGAIPTKDETQVRMDGVLRAERSRLQRVRWVARIKITLLVLAIATAVGAVAYLAKKYLPELLKRPPPPPPPALIKNQEAAAPAEPAKKVPGAKALPGKKQRVERAERPEKPERAEKPARPERPGKKKGHGRAPAAADEPASGDATLPPTPE